MSFDFSERTVQLLGEEASARIEGAKVAVFGLGGVGAALTEALVRAGVGELYLVDGDRISLSNLNRQLFALRSTLGMLKTDAAERRLHDINPDVKLHLYPIFYGEETKDAVPLTQTDYIADAIDTVSSKLLLAEIAYRENIPLISSMGTGAKLDPTRFEITDISKTSVCPLARVMRLECRKRGIGRLTVLYSKEEPSGRLGEKDPDSGKRPPCSISFVPSAAGLMMAGKIIRDLAEGKKGTSEHSARDELREFF